MRVSRPPHSITPPTVPLKDRRDALLLLVHRYSTVRTLPAQGDDAARVPQGPALSRSVATTTVPVTSTPSRSARLHTPRAAERPPCACYSPYPYVWMSPATSRSRAKGRNSPCDRRGQRKRSMCSPWYVPPPPWRINLLTLVVRADVEGPRAGCAALPSSPLCCAGAVHRPAAGGRARESALYADCAHLTDLSAPSFGGGSGSGCRPISIGLAEI